MISPDYCGPKKTRIRSVSKRKQLDDANAEITRIADIGIAWQKKTTDDAAAGHTQRSIPRWTGSSHCLRSRRWRHCLADDRRWSGQRTGCFGRSSGRQHRYRLDLCVRQWRATHSTPSTIVAFPTSEIYQQAAKEILEQTGVKRGFCLVIDGEEGKLAYELAAPKRTGSLRCGIRPDESCHSAHESEQGRCLRQSSHRA